jgi:hypothetical protein
VDYDVLADTTDCICGKQHIKFVFTIANRENGNELYPVGSSCVRKVGRDDMDEAMATMASDHRARERAAEKEAERVRKWGERTLSQGPWMEQPFSTICASYRGRNYVAFIRENARRKELKDLLAYANFISNP